MITPEDVGLTDQFGGASAFGTTGQVYIPPKPSGLPTPTAPPPVSPPIAQPPVIYEPYVRPLTKPDGMPVPGPAPVTPPPPPGSTTPIVPSDQPVSAPSSGSSSVGTMQIPSDQSGASFDSGPGASSAPATAGFSSPWVVALLAGGLLVALTRQSKGGK